jgi:hypothetical protein
VLRGFSLAPGRFVLGLLLQAQRLHLIGTLAELGDNLFLDRQHGVVEIPLGGGCGVARGCQRHLGGKFGILRGFERREFGCDRCLGVGDIGRGVGGDSLQMHPGRLAVGRVRCVLFDLLPFLSPFWHFQWISGGFSTC